MVLFDIFSWQLSRALLPITSHNHGTSVCLSRGQFVDSWSWRRSVRNKAHHHNIVAKPCPCVKLCEHRVKAPLCACIWLLCHLAFRCKIIQQQNEILLQQHFPRWVRRSSAFNYLFVKNAFFTVFRGLLEKHVILDIKKATRQDIDLDSQAFRLRVAIACAAGLPVPWHRK